MQFCKTWNSIHNLYNTRDLQGGPVGGRAYEQALSVCLELDKTRTSLFDRKSIHNLYNTRGLQGCPTGGMAYEQALSAWS